MKAQVTIFIITGMIIILLGLLLGVVITNELYKDESTRAATDPAPIKSFIDGCIERTAHDSLFFFGMVGGKIEPQHFSSFLEYDDYYKIPHWYYVGENRAPSDADVEQILQTYVNQNLKKCINNFSELSKTGWKFQDSQVSTKVYINDFDVIFNVFYPVTASRSDIKVEFTDFSIKILSRLKQILEASRYIVYQEVSDTQREGEPLIWWPKLSQIAKSNYNITAHAEQDNNIVYRIVDLDKNYMINNELYTLQFANKIR
ncbi:MAG: hypothetical protein QW331_03480 [Candidatus Woesearchaeota archaeon]